VNANRRSIPLLLALPLCACCVTYTPRPAEALAERADLRLRFETPRVVKFRTAEGDSLIHLDVTEVRGRLVERRGDSIVVQARYVDFAVRRGQRLSSGASAVFEVANLGVEEVDSHSGRTILLVIAIGLTLVAVIAAATREEPPPPPQKEPKGETTKG